MSSGAFAYDRYELDSGDVARIRVQPETLAANIGSVNSGATAAITIPGTVRTSNGNRAFGIKPRTVTLKWSAAAPAGYLAGSTVTIPILQAANWTAINNGDTGTYLGASVEVVGKSPERVR